MRPILCYIGTTPVPAFFPSIMVGALAMTWYAYRVARRRGYSPVVILDMALIGIVGGILGARVFHILVEFPGYYWEDPARLRLFEHLGARSLQAAFADWIDLRIFKFWQGGFVSLGAFLAAVGGWFLYFRMRRVPVLPYCDIAGEACPIVDFFVRLGCLLIGCCYGRPTDCPIHLTFTNPASTAYHFFPNLPLHATQPYFMASAVIGLFFLRWLAKRRWFDGQVGAAFLIYYGVVRFFIEFLRGDADRGVYLGGWISTGQIVMLGFVAAGIVMHRVGRRRAGA